MDLLCFSGLTWEHAAASGVPFPALVRRHARWLYVEPPLNRAGVAAPCLESWSVSSPVHPSIQVARLSVPQTACRYPFFATTAIQAICVRLLTELMQREQYHHALIWVRDALTLGFAYQLPHQVFIWDRRRVLDGRPLSVELLQADLLLIREQETEGTFIFGKRLYEL